MAELHVNALVIGTDTFFNSQSALFAALALRYTMPAMYQYREFAAAGGLVSYSGSITDAYHIAGVYTGRILKGEKSPQTYQFSRPKKSNYSSILKRQRLSVSTSRSPSWAAPTR